MGDKPTYPRYSVGPDELEDIPYIRWEDKPIEYIWQVYWYENTGYDGSGISIGYRKDGQFHFVDLSHCSCYGPGDDWKGEVLTEKDLRERIDFGEVHHRRTPDDWDYKQWEAVKDKVLELLDTKENPHKKCPKCRGCGQIANDEDETPWYIWENLPDQSKIAVQMGLVKPIPCPDCKDNSHD